MNKFYDTGEANKGKHGGHRTKLITEDHCVFLRELLAEDCTITLEYMQEQLEAVDGLGVSLSTIHNRIAGFHYSFKPIKNPRFVAITDVIKKQRREFSRWLINADGEGRNLVFLGEVGFTLCSRVNRGRTDKGVPADAGASSIRSKNLFVVCAIHSTGVVHHEVLEPMVDWEPIRQYLHRLQEALTVSQIEDPIIVTDSTIGFQCMDKVLQEMTSLRLTDRLTPPHSSLFNPVEIMFSQWKHYVRAQVPQSYEELTLAMRNAGNLWTPEDCKDYIARTKLSYQACIDGQDSFDT